MRLTDIVICSLEAPEKGATISYDDVVPGFGVRVSKGGTKSFILTHGPRRERETLARVGVVTLQAARAEAKRRLAEYTLGKNRPKTTAWRQAIDEYLAEVAACRRPRTHDSYKYALNKHFRYGITKLSEVSAQDLGRSLAKLVSTPSEQQHAFVALRAFIRWAYRKHYIDRNPMERMRSPHSYKSRERILTNEELKRVWAASGDDTFGHIIKILLLTGQRVGEITRLTGSMVGENTITLPSWLTKNGREHTFPIGRTAKTILNERASDKCLFPATGKTTPFNGRSSCKRKLDERSGVSDWTIHDLRRTFASGLASLGVPLPVIERLLNHISGSFGGIVGVYQRYDFMPEMRDGIARWEAHVQKVVGSDQDV